MHLLHERYILLPSLNIIPETHVYGNPDVASDKKTLKKWGVLLC